MSKGRRDKGEAVRQEIRGRLLVGASHAFAVGGMAWAEYGRRVFQYAADGCKGDLPPLAVDGGEGTADTGGTGAEVQG